MEHTLCYTQGAFFVCYNHHDLNLIQTILAQVDRDNCIVRLVETIDDVYSFVNEAEQINKSNLMVE
jgi:hypothetical protein